MLCTKMTCAERTVCKTKRAQCKASNFTCVNSCLAFVAGIELSRALHAKMALACTCHCRSWTPTSMAGWKRARIEGCKQQNSSKALKQDALAIFAQAQGSQLGPQHLRSDWIPSGSGSGSVQRSRPSRILYNATIAACGRSNAWRASVALLSELRHVQKTSVIGR